MSSPVARTAAVLVHALVQLSERTVPLDVAELETWRNELLALLDELGVPVAVIMRGGSVFVANTGWRDKLGWVPRDVWDRMATVSTPSGIIELELDREAAGIPVHYAAEVHPFRGSFGVPSGVVITCTDVTEQATARKLAVDSDTLIWSGPVRGQMDYANAAWITYVGSADHWERALHPADHHRCMEAFAQAARVRMSADTEVRLRRADGQYRWHRVNFVSATEEARWYGTAADIHDARNRADERNELLSQARAARADAEQATRLKDEFLASVSHELRAPLTTMLLWEKVLREPGDDRAKQLALDAIRQSALAQSRIVGDLLDVSRAISGKLHVDLRTIELADVVGAALESALPAALARRIQLTYKGGRGATIAGDVTRLRQVLDNVLANAIKFTEPGGAVTVSTRTTGREISIDVEDTGRGIPADQIDRIFEPFYQSDDLLTRRHGGLGLGLTISRQLVELHGGALTARSAGLGHGSTFTITLPIAQRRRMRTPSPQEPVRSLERRRILVVDDDPRVRDALRLLLARTGAHVETASSAADARERLVASKPDLIICDIAMPDEDGYSFIRIARATGCTVPAIALTAHAMEADATRAIDAGFDVHLAKPVHFERLVSTIGSLIATTSPAVP